jgi:hypothetical protein
MYRTISRKHSHIYLLTNETTTPTAPPCSHPCSSGNFDVTMLGSRGERTLIHSKSKFGEDVGKDVYFCNVAERKRVCSSHRGHTHSHIHTIVTVIVSLTYHSHASLSPPT